MEFLEGLEKLERELSNLSLTPSQKKAMTKAGAEVYKESLKNNLNSSLHKGPHSRRSNIKLADDISLKYKGADGATYVGFKNTPGHSGYVARILNDGYMAHGGKGASEHTTKYVPGLHFQERTINETKALVLAAEVKKYKEMLGD